MKLDNIPEVIELRGHHLISFASRFYGMSVDENWEELFSDNHKLMGYGSAIIEHILELTNYFKQNPSLEFRIVEGADIVCKKCNLKKECSADKMAYEDVLSLEKIGFEVGKSYKVSELYELDWN